MAPESDGAAMRTVGCSFERLVPDAAHRTTIRDAVESVHKTEIERRATQSPEEIATRHASYRELTDDELPQLLKDHGIDPALQRYIDEPPGQGLAVCYVQVTPSRKMYIGKHGHGQEGKSFGRPVGTRQTLTNAPSCARPSSSTASKTCVTSSCGTGPMVR